MGSSFQRPSTRRCAVAALGHHSWYDGSHPYPGGYQRLAYPERQIVDVIGLIDWLTGLTEPGALHTGAGETFDGAVEAAIALEGKRFSPLLTARLRNPGTVERIRRAMEEGRLAACRETDGT